MAVEGIRALKNYLNNYQLSDGGKQKAVAKNQTAHLEKQDESEKINYTEAAQKEEINAIKRPIKINNSNNIFFVNYKGENRSIKIDPGEYNLTELQAALQQRVNEDYGIGKLKLTLTASTSDRLIFAEDKKQENILDELA